eukprot:524409_1
MGQSGSVIWFTNDNSAVIFSIHTGGSNKYKYNVATIINDTIFNNIMRAIVTKGLNFVPRLAQLNPNKPHRVLMVLGRTGCGKTTTLNSPSINLNLKSKISEFVVEKVPIKWVKCGKKMRINGSKVIFDSNSGGIFSLNQGKNTVYSSEIPWSVLNDGIIECKIKILTRLNYCGVDIGIVGSTKYTDNTDVFGKGNNEYNVGYSCTGFKETHTDGIDLYGSSYSVHDTISIRLDVNNKNISFSKNNISQGIAKANIKIIKYRIAVHMGIEIGGSSGSIEMISCLSKK